MESQLGFTFKYEDVGNPGVPSDKYQIVKWFKKGGYRSPKNEWDSIQTELIDNMIQLEKLLKPFLNTTNQFHKAS